ncbi:MAG TPA: response regulator [Candidatus Sulfopaludibacter sp.]|nr:response regulator [Candidatus Sulfopaludibacter sp.]
MKLPLETNPQILLVDDNQDGLIVRKSLLEELGYRVQLARNGEEGLKLYQDSTFDVVVTDYRMPRMDGVELIGRIRKHNPNARIILLSGFVEPLGLTEENTGADAVIAKSSNEPLHLVRWVKRLLNRATSRKPPAAVKRLALESTRASGR